MADKVSRDRVYRSDAIALSRDMGPLNWEFAKGGGGKTYRAIFWGGGNVP